jgi:hypothetical protein
MFDDGALTLRSWFLDSRGTSAAYVPATFYLFKDTGIPKPFACVLMENPKYLTQLRFLSKCSDSGNVGNPEEIRSKPKLRRSKRRDRRMWRLESALAT